MLTARAGGILTWPHHRSIQTFRIFWERIFYQRLQRQRSHCYSNRMLHWDEWSMPEVPRAVKYRGLYILADHVLAAQTGSWMAEFSRYKGVPRLRASTPLRDMNKSSVEIVAAAAIVASWRRVACPGETPVEIIGKVRCRDLERDIRTAWLD